MIGLEKMQRLVQKSRREE
uniref:Uncharacterized protein n=1 Tax=Arundo donax TaxID=35708 RepID=A0A0A9BSZ7_ARUDO